LLQGNERIVPPVKQSIQILKSYGIADHSSAAYAAGMEYLNVE